MDDSIFLQVQFIYRTHKFSITSRMRANSIRDEIGRYFRINMEKFLLEVLDKRFNIYFVLDDEYLKRLRTNPNVSADKLFVARIRSLDQSRYNIPFDPIALERSSTETASPQPDHIVVWLDEYIGEPENCRQMKNHFTSVIAIDWGNLVFSKTNDDIDNLIRVYDSYVVPDCNFTDIKEEIYTFSTSEDCLVFINKVSKSQRKIFIICSGSLGRTFVPEIYRNKSVHSIYILTCNISNHYEWACDYIDKLYMFNHDLDLLARLARDIARHYENKASNEIEINPRHSLTYLYWSKRLLTNANTVDNHVTSNWHLPHINKKIDELEKVLNSKHDEEEKETNAVSCAEL